LYFRGHTGAPQALAGVTPAAENTALASLTKCKNSAGDSTLAYSDRGAGDTSGTRIRRFVGPRSPEARGEVSSDFMADCLGRWIEERGAALRGVRKPALDLDNGPENSEQQGQGP
jgi:hypothetical protein